MIHFCSSYARPTSCPRTVGSPFSRFGPDNQPRSIIGIISFSARNSKLAAYPRTKSTMWLYTPGTYLWWEEWNRSRSSNCCFSGPPRACQPPMTPPRVSPILFEYKHLRLRSSRLHTGIWPPGTCQAPMRPLRALPYSLMSQMPISISAVLAFRP